MKRKRGERTHLKRFFKIERKELLRLGDVAFRARTSRWDGLFVQEERRGVAYKNKRIGKRRGEWQTGEENVPIP